MPSPAATTAIIAAKYLTKTAKSNKSKRRQREFIVNAEDIYEIRFLLAYTPAGQGCSSSKELILTNISSLVVVVLFCYGEENLVIVTQRFTDESRKSGNSFLQFVFVDVTSSANTEHMTSVEHFQQCVIFAVGQRCRWFSL